MYKFLDWKSCAIFYENTYSTELYGTIFRALEDIGVKFVGDVEKNGFEVYWTKNEFLDFMIP